MNKAWPGVLVAFGNFGENQIDFCSKTLDGRIIRVSLDRSLFGSADLAQAIYAMRAFDVKTDEPTPQIQVAERLERQLKRMPRRLRTRSRLKGNAFFREIGRHKLLNHDEEKRLRRQYLPGTRHSARDRMILANLRLVVSIAGRYQKRGIGWDDLLQEGILGLMKAADKFDPDKGFRFSTYATWWIMQSITRAIAEQPPLIGTPCYLAENLLKYRRYFKDFIQEHGFIPSDCDICDHFAMSKSEWRIFRQVRSAWFGLRKLDVSMTCRATESPEECASGSECQTFVSGFIADQFDARTAEIMHRRFGIGDRPEETLEMIGQSMKVTRERIRQIEAKAIQTFRDL